MRRARMLKEMLQKLGPEFGFLAEEAGEVEQDVMNRLDRSVKLDEVDTITFGLETDDGKIVKVYVKADQAEDFEKALAEKLGKVDDIEEVLNELSKEYEIVDVEWPTEEVADEAEEQDDGSEVLDPKVHDNAHEDREIEKKLKPNLEHLDFGERAALQVNEANNTASIETRFTTAAQLMVYHAILQLGLPEVALSRNPYRAAIIKNIKSKAMELQQSPTMKNALKLFINRSIDYDERAAKHLKMGGDKMDESLVQEETVKVRRGPAEPEDMKILDKRKADGAPSIEFALVRTPEREPGSKMYAYAVLWRSYDKGWRNGVGPWQMFYTLGAYNSDAEPKANYQRSEWTTSGKEWMREILDDPKWKPVELDEALLVEGPVQDFWGTIIKLVQYLAPEPKDAADFLDNVKLKQLMVRGGGNITNNLTSQLRTKLNDLKTAVDKATTEMATEGQLAEGASIDEVISTFSSLLSIADPTGEMSKAIMSSSSWNKFFNSAKPTLPQKFGGQLRQKMNSVKLAIPASLKVAEGRKSFKQIVEVKNAELAHPYKYGSEAFEAGHPIEVIGEDGDSYIVKPFPVMANGHMKLKKSDVKLTGKINVPVGGPGGAMPGGLNEEAPQDWMFDTEAENVIISCANLKVALNPEETEKLIKGITNKDAVVVRDEEDPTHKVAFSPRGSSVMVKKVGTTDGVMMNSREIDKLLDFIAKGFEDKPTEDEDTPDQEGAETADEQAEKDVKDVKESVQTAWDLMSPDERTKIVVKSDPTMRDPRWKPLIARMAGSKFAELSKLQQEMLAGLIKEGADEEPTHGITFTRGARVGARSHRMVDVAATSEDDAIKKAKVEFKKRFPSENISQYRVSNVFEY